MATSKRLCPEGHVTKPLLDMFWIMARHRLFIICRTNSF